MNSQKLGSSGPSECRVWIGNCNVKVCKSTEHKLHNIWRSLKFCVNSGKRAHPCWATCTKVNLFGLMMSSAEVTRPWGAPRVTSCTHFCSMRCILNKVVSACPHFYYLPTSRAPFAHLDTPLSHTMSASSQLMGHAQTTSRCPEMSVNILTQPNIVSCDIYSYCKDSSTLSRYERQCKNFFRYSMWTTSQVSMHLEAVSLSHLRLISVTRTLQECIPGVCSFCCFFAKIIWVSHFVEFVLGRFLPLTIQFSVSTWIQFAFCCCFGHITMTVV